MVFSLPHYQWLFILRQQKFPFRGIPPKSHQSYCWQGRHVLTAHHGAWGCIYFQALKFFTHWKYFPLAATWCPKWLSAPWWSSLLSTTAMPTCLLSLPPSVACAQHTTPAKSMNANCNGRRVKKARKERHGESISATCDAKKMIACVVALWA